MNELLSIAVEILTKNVISVLIVTLLAIVLRRLWIIIDRLEQIEKYQAALLANDNEKLVDALRDAHADQVEHLSEINESIKALHRE